MRRAALRSSLPFVALLFAACSESGPVAPEAELDLDGGAPLAAVLPDLAPEPGTVGTERYVPTLERVFGRAARVVREKAGAGAADALTAEARVLHQAVRAAREAQDSTALAEAVRRLEGFQARVAVRVFGPDVARHVHGEAAGRLRALGERVQAAKDAGSDVARWEAGARLAARHLAAAREAAAGGRPAVALVHASHSLDLTLRIAAALG